MGSTGGDEHALRIRDRGPHPTQILAQRNPQLVQSPRWPIPERGVRQLAHSG